jgi:hypothetical protein
MKKHIGKRRFFQRRVNRKILFPKEFSQVQYNCYG